MEDNWKHRSDNMKCKTCIYFVPKVPAGAVVAVDSLAKMISKGPGKVRELKPGQAFAAEFDVFDFPAYHLGRCRRHAPTLSGWPAVFVNDWCGDHKLDENRMRPA